MDSAVTAPAVSLSQVQVSRLIRARLDLLLVDDSSTAPQEAAIYTLCDPRDLRCARYVGQTRSPRRRLLQHLNGAKLWLPDELPWWVKDPELRPLYDWIRGLFRDGFRLPIMIIREWSSCAAARSQERQRIMEGLANGESLFNVEARLTGSQLVLPLGPGAFDCAGK
jgi:hypothetical protein